MVQLIPTAADLIERLPRPLRRHRLMTAWMRLTGESPVQLVRIRDDIFGYADMSDGFLRLIVINKNYDPDFFTVADALLTDGGVCFDVGANYGLLSFGLAGRHGGGIDFHLFEPNLKLVETIGRTRLRFPQMRCTINAVAVSDRPGTVSFIIDETQSGASHISKDGGVDVPSVTLDSYIAEKDIDRVDLLKLDVEGYELRACRGVEASLRSGRIQAVYFEYFEKYLIRVSQPGALIDFLDSVGFTTCFCRANDYAPRGGPSHTLAEELRGNGLKLLPVEGHSRPSMIDLLAVPRENLVPLAR
jgi:FkbM family methyltransferase